MSDVTKVQLPAAVPFLHIPKMVENFRSKSAGNSSAAQLVVDSSVGGLSWLFRCDAIGFPDCTDRTTVRSCLYVSWAKHVCIIMLEGSKESITRKGDVYLLSPVGNTYCYCKACIKAFQERQYVWTRKLTKRRGGGVLNFNYLVEEALIVVCF